MTRRLLAIPLILLFLVSSALAAYTYYDTENLYTPTLQNWTFTGTYTPTWYAPGNYGGVGIGLFGDMVRSVTSGVGEMATTIRMDGSSYGSFDLLVGMTTVPNPNNDPYAAYQGYAVNVAAGYTGGGAPFGYVSLVRRWYNYSQGALNNTNLVSMTPVAAHDGMVVRTVFRPGSGLPSQNNNQIIVYIDNVLVLNYTDTNSPLGTSGSMGFEVYQASGGTLLSQVSFGTLDTTAPNGPSSITDSATTNQINIQWTAATDNTNGSGVYGYQVWRNGQLLTTTTGLSYVDTASIVPSTTYQYELLVLDYHMNATADFFSVTTPGVPTNGPFPSATPDGRRIGVRPTGAYWGGTNENIDVLSGNLNLTFPLFKALGRGSWGVPFSLVYNSQMWRQDSGGQWLYDGDVGYGFGWKLLAGQITPVWNPGGLTAAYYLFTDSTGAEYRLDQNTSNVWTSKESVYVYFDANVDVLHFKDGSFWSFGCVSAATESDSGVMHPTLMEDTNGNQVLVRYQQAPGANWPNSSARITQIQDVRARIQNDGSIATYQFGYNTDSIPHLTSIQNFIGTGEAYNFTYSSAQPIASPMNGQSFGTTTTLHTAVVTTLGMTHTFTYDGSGEITKINVPYGGYLAYDYGTTSYTSGIKYREVVKRHLSKDGTVTSDLAYPISHEPSPGSTVHQYTKLDDPSGTGEKYWVFATTGLAEGLVTQYQGRQLPGPVTKTQNDLTWAQDSLGNSYIATNLTTLDTGQSYQAQKKTTQTVDTYGNVTQVKVYTFGNLTTAARTYTYTYLNSSTYTSIYIRNRLATATVTDGTNNVTLASNTYDQNNLVAAPSGLYEWDTNYSSTTFTTRGNLSQSITPSGISTFIFDTSGRPVSTTSNGVTTQLSSNSSNNFAAPTQLTVGSLTTNLGWSSFLALTNETGPNGDSASTGYDQYARPASSTSPFGASTSITYSNPPYSTSAPPTITSTTNGRWTRQTMDGIGRTILTESGDASSTKSQAESVYGPCACSPMGKLMQQAMPHIVGGTVKYTTYTYDGIGRTLTVLSPDGASTTTYLYQGNTVKVTDPAGKWKQFTMDAFGNLTQVAEPNPAGGSNYGTTYTYDLINNLKQVSMPRPTGTQTRTFVYSGPYLQSATNPENGTVTYTYNTYNKVATKTDAKGQAVVYTYDTLARLTKVQRYPQGTSHAEDTCQQENYSYDTNPYDSTYSQYAAGRLTAVQYYGGSAVNIPVNGGTNCDTIFTEMYNYGQPGGKVGKRLRLTRILVNGTYGNPQTYQQVPTSVDLNSTYTYDNEGRTTATQYPSHDAGTAGPNLGWAFDTMGRLNTMTDLATQFGIITGSTYGPSNELLTMAGQSGETRTYNSMLQLTSLVASASSGQSVNITYAYSTTQNNGKITSQTDNISGEQVQYTYDALNRLATAKATSNSWGQSYSYDGFGNLTDQNVIAGSAPTYHVVPGPTTNRVGSTDANGNTTGSGNYDIENRLIGYGGAAGPYGYSYAPGNKRVWRGVWTTGTLTTDEVSFWSVGGQKLATYGLYVLGGIINQSSNPAQLVTTQTGTSYYFGSRLIKNTGGYLAKDRLGSIGHFYPYGLEKPSATQNGTEKFTGYFRDAETGLDYADQRHHSPGTGRFMTADPYSASVGPTDPGSWNRYAYTRGDPINRFDPSGLEDEDLDSNVGAGPFSSGPIDFSALEPGDSTAPLDIGYTVTDDVTDSGDSDNNDSEDTGTDTQSTPDNQPIDGGFIFKTEVWGQRPGAPTTGGPTIGPVKRPIPTIGPARPKPARYQCFFWPETTLAFYGPPAPPSNNTDGGSVSVIVTNGRSGRGGMKRLHSGAAYGSQPTAGRVGGAAAATNYLSMVMQCLSLRW